MRQRVSRNYELALEARLSAPIQLAVPTGPSDRRPNEEFNIGSARAQRPTSRVAFTELAHQPAVSQTAYHEAEFKPKIVAMCARGLNAREIAVALVADYGIAVGSTFINSVIDQQLCEANGWRGRRLDAMYPAVFFDTLLVTLRDKGAVSRRAVIIAIGIGESGEKSVLGFWIAGKDGHDMERDAVDELKRRGVEGICFAVVDDMQLYGRALRTAFPSSRVIAGISAVAGRRVCMPSTNRTKAACMFKRALSGADNEQQAKDWIDALVTDRVRGESAKLLQSKWSDIAHTFALPIAIRRLICTSNALDSLVAKLNRRGIKARAHFHSEEAATRSLALVFRGASSDWRVAPTEWFAVERELVPAGEACPARAELRHELRG